jgi:4-nitrophenyl phosphatase
LQEVHGIDFERAVLVGDRLETDIRFGKELGMETALVLSGVTDEETARTADDPPDHVLESIAAVPAVVD